jgi:hypothetical protein
MLKTTQILAVQTVVLLALGWSIGVGPMVPGAAADSVAARPTKTVVPVTREKPLHVKPLHDDPELVSDQELADVLWKILPRFAPEKRKPNFVEHALRVWTVDVTFKEPGVMSGPEMKEFLTQHGKYLASWDGKVEPLLVEEPQNGVAIRWGAGECASVHHDHWLACLTEAGVSLREPLYTPSSQLHTINDAVQQALRDVDADEREIEWSPLAFAMWIAPAKSWENGDGRRLSFDILARRLMRGVKWGVCAGTHRVYSLAALLRIDTEEPIFSPAMRAEVTAYLKNVRDSIQASQFPDGHWSSNWYDGEKAVSKPVEEELFRKIIATGHHLEWMSIVPEELQIPREQIHKAAKWCIATIGKETPESTQKFYTFYSHVGAALAGWRKTTPAEFYMAWESEHGPRVTKAPAKAKPETARDAAH